MDKNQGVIQLTHQILRIGHKIRREKSSVELHTINHIDVGLDALTFFNRDHAVFTDFIEGVSHDLADFDIVVGTDRCDTNNVFLVIGVNRLAQLSQCFINSFNSYLDTAVDRHRVSTRGDITKRSFENRFGQDSRGGRPVTGNVGRFAGCFFNERTAEIFSFITELYLFSYRHPILGHRRTAPAFIQQNISASGTKSRFDSVGKFPDTLEKGFTSVDIKG